MTEERKTETMSRPTETLPRPAETLLRKTETLESAKTMTLEGAGQTLAASEYIYIGAEINGYIPTEVISENTGEASIFICEKADQKYVIKIYHKNKRPKQETLERINAIQSPYVLKTLDHGEYQERYFEILTYYEKGDLERFGKLDDDFLIKQVIPNVNEGLRALHDAGIVHRDIKPNNIFYDDFESKVVIGDFGISSILNEGMSVRMTSMSRTLGYSAPETANGHISKEVDYYSFGITLLQLATGRDPFEGMTDQQIMLQTLNYKLPIPNTVSDRMAHLIKGLSVKDRQNRWGYEEIKRWLNQEYIPISEAVVRKDIAQPYSFAGSEFVELSDLAMAFATNWDEAMKHLYRGLVADHLKQYGQEMQSKAMDCSEEPNQDLGLFRLIYTMHPDAPLCWRGEIFWDLYELRNKMTEQLPEVNEAYYQLFESGAFIEYLKLKQVDETLITDLTDVLQVEDRNEKYWRFSLSLQNTGENPESVFKYRGEAFTSVDEVAQYLTENIDQLEERSAELLDDAYFFLWLEYLGFESQLKHLGDYLRS